MTKEIHSTDFEIGQQSNIIVTSDELLGKLRNSSVAVDPKWQKKYLSDLAFMEEEVTVMVHEDVNPNAENPIMVGNGGRHMAFFRGKQTKCKRKFLDSLIVKQTSVSTPEIVTGANEKSFSIRQVSALKYPFSIISDKSKHGGDWLAMRMAEAV